MRPYKLFAAAAALAATVASDACSEMGEWFEEATTGDNSTIPTNPRIVQSCLRSIPFDAPETDALTTALSKTAAFLSLQHYQALNVLPALEIPKFNINDTFAGIRKKTKAREYKNMLDFWLDVRDVFGRYQDGHTNLRPKCTDLIAYEHDYPIAAVGSNIWTVEIEQGDDPNGNSKVDLKLKKKITRINDEPAADYLAKLANRMSELGFGDPDARWNALMIQFPQTESSGYFARRTAWDEKKDAMTLTFDGGEKVEVKWRAEVMADVVRTVRELSSAEVSAAQFRTATELRDAWCYVSRRGIETMKQGLANNFWYENGGLEVTSQFTDGPTILNTSTSGADTNDRRRLLEPRQAGGDSDDDDSQPTSTIDDSTPSATSTGNIWFTTAVSGYPKPEKRGPEDLILIFRDPSDKDTAILRLPGFSGEVDDVDAYLTFVSEELPRLKREGVKRLIIDVIGNSGGLPVYIKAIRRVLRTSAPDFHTPGRFRWNPVLDEMIRAHIADPDGTAEVENDFLPERFERPDGTPFTSIDELLGPELVRGDTFFALAALKEETAPLKSMPLPPKDLWGSDDIIVITNGMCSSACHLFVEAMTHKDVGSRAYALGGRPTKKGMQAVGGTKGGTNVKIETLINSMYGLIPNALENPNVPDYSYKTRIGVSLINIEDQFANNNDDGNDLPLQYRYRPACKKILYTEDMVMDVKKVWARVKEAAWDSDGKKIECDYIVDPYRTVADVIWGVMRPNEEL